jgi:predicted negative regulator of RcsB-dependent stress response
MAISEVVSRSFGEAVSPSPDDTAATEADGAAPTSGSKTTAFLLATLLTLASVGLLGYTQWWVPREEAQQVAKVNYQRCLEEVKVYKGKKSYKGRLAQCSKFLGD